jgi:hypothetical protein
MGEEGDIPANTISVVKYDSRLDLAQHEIVESLTTSNQADTIRIVLYSWAPA